MTGNAQLRVLICQPFFYRFSGSEVIALELADALSSENVDVSLVVHGASPTMQDELKKIPGRLFIADSADFHEYASQTPPDLVWIHQGFIPQNLMNSTTRFVFAHLSSFNAFEFSFNPRIEAILAQRIYFVSEEAKEAHLSTGVYDAIESSRFRILRNPAPRTFFTPLTSTGLPMSLLGSSHPLRTLLVVSNHLPKEVVDAISLLSTRGVTVKTVGIPQPGTHASQERVTGDLIRQYDAVMSIGKTVQYALCGGRPVYCYDYFGGPGWLSEENFDAAEFHNFSGRGFHRRSNSESLVEELITGYGDAVRFTNEHIQKFQLSYSYNRVIKDLHELLEEPAPHHAPIPKADAFGYAKAHESVANFGKGYFEEQSTLTQLRAEIERSHEEIRLKANHISNLEGIIAAQSNTLQQKQSEDPPNNPEKPRKKRLRSRWHAVLAFLRQIRH